jgi:hypothetical protein
MSPDDQKIMQLIEFTEFSDTVWVVSPPAREALLTALRNNVTVSVVASMTFTRSKAPDNIVRIMIVLSLLKCRSGLTLIVFNNRTLV